MHQGTRGELLGRLAEAVASIKVAHPTRVAIDGPPAAGKTTLGDELAVVLRAQGREVIRATIDDFLFPRAQRYRRGEFSAESCYFDAHDHDAVNRVLLDPLGPGGDRRFQPAVHDHTTPVGIAADDAVLVFDGVFLMRPELIERWDLRIFVSIALDKTVERAVIRERQASSRAAVERRWRERYLPAQQLYFAAVRPTEEVDIIVHNDEPQQPAWEERAKAELTPLRADHAPAVLAFELANRAYFAASISDRGDRYFEEFADRHNAMLAEQEAGICAFYLLVAEDGAVLGRFNLFDIRDHTADVGYRVAQRVAGRGVATSAVRQLCRLAEARHGLRTLRAAASRQNVASQRVLIKAGFTPVGPADPAHLGGKAGTWYERRW